jgi:hypothetical protein
MFASPSSCIGILTPKVIAVGSGDFERWLGHENGDLIIEISAIKAGKDLESYLDPLAMWEYS